MALPEVDDAHMIRVLIVDDHVMFAESVARLLDREADMTVIGVASDSRNGVEVARAEQPDIAIVDYGLPDADGTQTAAEIRVASPNTRVLLLTGQLEDGVATVAIQAGCSGFLTKDKAGHELVSAARVVHSGKAFIPPAHLADLHRGLAAQHVRTEFLARISHEFRTPLTSIIGYGRLIAHRELPTGTSREVGEEIVRSAERLQRIVEILEFTASSSSGGYGLRPSPTSPAEVVDAAIERWTPRAAPGYDLRAAVDASLAPVVADSHWLTIALDELIDNALKFSPEGGAVTLGAALVELDGRPAVEFSVSDEGIGMAPSAREVAFEEFMQMDSSDTREFNGLGLGLSLVRGVAQAHGGVALCTPMTTRGTRVAVVIPLGASCDSVGPALA